MQVTPLHEILKKGVEAGASDWHIREDANVALRINGEMVTQIMATDRVFLDEVMAAIATEKDMRKYEETGDADFAIDEEGVGRFRVNVHRQRSRTAMTLRHVKAEVPNIRDLRLPPILLSLAEAKDGIVFVTGSTGSGKSTTLACMIEHINETKRSHLITVEDPIEYNFADKMSVIEQREVGLDTISFDSALRHALRQDPDTIVIGELRSRDSFESALTAAETGHLVMTTLHTSTAAQSIGRILDFYPFDERDAVRKNLAGNLRAIVCQRLLPRAHGAGVVPINEILINTPIVSKLILEDKINRLEGAISAGKEDGMQSFNHSIMPLIKNGDITEEVGMRFATNPEALKMNLQGIFLSESGTLA